MSALLSAEDTPERSGGVPQRIAGVVRSILVILLHDKLIMSKHLRYNAYFITILPLILNLRTDFHIFLQLLILFPRQ
jgi:hypothetical protein